MQLLPGSFIEVGKVLQVDDYIQSPNGLFFGHLQPDGNFCIYLGSSPSDKHEVVWGHARAYSTNKKYCACLQPDGNFCVYEGTSPNNSPIWCTDKWGENNSNYFAAIQSDGNFCIYKGKSSMSNQSILYGDASGGNPLTKIQSISDINYDLQKASIKKIEDHWIYEQEIKNDSNSPQTTTIGGKYSYKETTGWQDEWKSFINVQAELKCKIPIVVDGKATLSAESSYIYSSNSTIEKNKEWEFSSTLTVEPHSAGIASVIEQHFIISVPYELSARCTFRSGLSASVKLRGKYDGTSSHDVVTHYKSLEKNEVNKIIQQAKSEGRLLS